MFKNYSNYEVYEDGRIWSYWSNKFLKLRTNHNGYQVVGLTDDKGMQKLYMVHRVVYESVTSEPIPEGYEINHRNEDKTDNRFENLELLTHKENINFGTRNRRVKKALSKQVGAFKNGELVMKFQSTLEAQRAGFYSSAVSYCCNGNRKTHKGYEWRYL